MYLRRNRRSLPISAWLVPILVIIVVVGAIVFDYREQHRSFTVFGTTVDSHNLRQVLVEPKPNDPGRTTHKVYKISAHRQLISILKTLSQAKFTGQAPVQQKNSLLDNVFIEFQKHSWELQLLQAPLSNRLYVQYNGKLFETPSQIVQEIQRQP